MTPPAKVVHEQVKPKNTEDFSYVRLKQELEDSKVYFLNELRRELSQEDHSEEKKQYSCLRHIDH